jgi:HNH endonuclease
MPTKPLDRLMFAQGDLCFFCKQPIPKSEASVEHLLASANGGSNSDENCVACCKSVNALLGSMSLKEKFQVVLNQKGLFKCPNGIGSAKAAAKPKAPAIAKPKDDKLALVVANLKQRGNSKPRKLKTLKSSIASLFPKGLSEPQLDGLVKQLESAGVITVIDNKVTYAL